MARSPKSDRPRETLRFLAVLAHPDDETLGMGGVFAKYAAEGIETHLVTATRGDQGRFRGIKDGPTHPGSERLAVIRDAELREAAKTLGIRTVVQLGYPDGRLDAVDPLEAIGRIAASIRSIRPQVVATFPHDGAYGHPDHVAISQLTTAAVVEAADPARRLPPEPAGALAPHAVAKLYYFVSSEPRWNAYQTAFKKLTSTVDGVERQAQPWPDWSVTTVVDTRAHWETVWKAVTCHDSQVAGYETLRTLSAEHQEALWGQFEFYRAMSRVNGGRRRERDLFEGLRDAPGPAEGARAPERPA